MKNDELYHYGVLGMKWGVRRAKNKIQKAKKLEAQGEKEKAKVLRDKASKSLSKHTVRSGGKKSFDYSVNESLGKSVCKSILMGTHGALRYNEVKAKTKDRGKAAVVGVLTAFGNGATYGAYSIVEPRLRK